MIEHLHTYLRIQLDVADFEIYDRTFTYIHALLYMHAFLGTDKKKFFFEKQVLLQLLLLHKKKTVHC